MSKDLITEGINVLSWSVKLKSRSKFDGEYDYFNYIKSEAIKYLKILESDILRLEKIDLNFKGVLSEYVSIKNLYDLIKHKQKEKRGRGRGRKMKNSYPIVYYFEPAKFNKDFLQIKKAVQIECNNGIIYYKKLSEINFNLRERHHKNIGNITSNLMKLDMLEIETSKDVLHVADLSYHQRQCLKKLTTKGSR